MESDPPKKIAIAGGGFAGVATIIMLKEEGIEPICFEKTDKPGGTWCYREEAVVGVPSIMPTTIINHSKELGAISNYPPPKELPNYMRHAQLYEYFMNYAKSNDALRYIHFNSEVIEVKRASDHEKTGKWIVGVRNTISGVVQADEYDGVVTCVGHINIPKWPSYRDQHKFQGTIIHSHSVKGVMPYVNKTVVVVGMGCSGLDAAVEICSVAKQVYLSTRSGAHVINRVGPNGLPVDYVMLRRYITSLIDILPINFLSWFIETCVLDPKFNSRLCAVKPKWHILSKDPILNDHLASKLLSGSVIQKRDIQRFTEQGVLFEGESSVTEADVVIMATGYTWKFPFLEEDIRSYLEKDLLLYKGTWPTNLKYSTLAFVGFFLPFGPGFPIGELQCRWVAQVLAGKAKLPPIQEMMENTSKRREINKRRYIPNDRLSIRVDYTQFLDELAEQIGAKPNLLKIFFTDPKLWYKLMFGPCVSYQYRLQGPHQWEGAREAIMTCDERVFWPLKREDVNKVESSFIHYVKKFFFFLLPFT